MAAKKGKKTKPKSSSPIDTQAGATALSVQPPPTSVVTEEHAPILSKPRKKKKKQRQDDSSNHTETSSDTGPVTATSVDGTCSELIDLQSNAGSDQALSLVQSKATEGTESSDTSPIDREEENRRHWGIEEAGARDTTKTSATTSPIDLGPLGQPKNSGAVKGSGKQTEWFNPARQEALEAVSDFKTRILERAAKQARNDTRFKPSPYPNDLYLYDKPSNSPEDNAMLKLKRGFDAAVIELDSSQIPEKSSIPLNIAKRAAMYVCGLLKSHDGQFRCAIDSLRGSVEKGQPAIAPWLADMWDERLLDSDRDWLLGEKIDEMDEEKARSHIGNMMEFIMKYKLWGQMVETECEDIGVAVYPRLN
ncbi:hypothetical protein CBER1_08840 [Cercospora berteroae]|uniref:Uncharacterized protein n=1 Tax=Cercospora berteroae TaxID=357750 RepID=A0A2S6CKG7_9PEZI|nr:hypothetical protein CBER1_08840 [Cercospora berteroae]